jgi:hypothetical protein
MEIGSNTDYSTTEKIIGTWIDGKPLYQKTIHLPDESTKNGRVEFAHGISDIEKIIKCIGNASYMTGGTIKTPFSIPFLELNGNDLNNSGRATISINPTNAIFTAYNFSYPFVDIYATIQYTKTTD